MTWQDCLGKSVILTHNHRMNRILIAGSGDIALRFARNLSGNQRLFGLLRNPARQAELRAAGITPLMGDLDKPRSLHRLGGLAHTVLHFAPPPTAAPESGDAKRTPLVDTRTRNLLAALSQGKLPRRLIYISTRACTVTVMVQS